MMQPSTALQVFFILSAITILTVSLIPGLNARFVSYGSRAFTSRSRDGAKQSHGPPASESRYHVDALRKMFDWLAALRVPHSYFLHFYIASVLSSVFWLYHILIGGKILRGLCASEARLGSKPSMSHEQILLTWSLMTVQGLRRLLESLWLSQPSSSKMWFVHWVLGIAFYLAMGVAVWIDGAGELLNDRNVMSGLQLAPPSPRTLLSIPIFLMASGIQHDCHAYLASLPKYSLPQHPLFTTFVCPHYAAECAIYLSMAFMAAPSGLWLNRTIIAAFVFVSVNLSITAADTKTWYEQKYGKEKIAHRWKMLPGVW